MYFFSLSTTAGVREGGWCGCHSLLQRYCGGSRFSNDLHLLEHYIIPIAKTWSGILLCGMWYCNNNGRPTSTATPQERKQERREEIVANSVRILKTYNIAKSRQRKPAFVRTVA